MCDGKDGEGRKLAIVCRMRGGGGGGTGGRVGKLMGREGYLEVSVNVKGERWGDGGGGGCEVSKRERQRWSPAMFQAAGKSEWANTDVKKKMK